MAAGFHWKNKCAKVLFIWCVNVNVVETKVFVWLKVRKKENFLQCARKTQHIQLNAVLAHIILFVVLFSLSFMQSSKNVMKA